MGKLYDTDVSDAAWAIVEPRGAVAELVEIGVAAPPASSDYRFRQRGQCLEVQAVRRGSANRPPCAL
jgi:hypothetical protein